jgi:Ca-activated chloride channel family protein
METKGALLDRDFQLFYTVSDKDFGLSLITYRPDPEQPGMFLALLAPKSEIAEKDRVSRDLVLVLDTSGSMKGSKIEQAKKSLKFCLEKLDKGDRFAIVQFSTMAQTYAEGWTEATSDNIKKAQEWVEKFEAAGGTNFSETLGKVFALKYDDSRPATVFFVTDGQPTVDVTDNEALMKIVKEHNKKGLRIFTFGVGDEDVNTKLLDRMAGESGGLPEYIRGGEAMDAKITRLFSKMTHPVLTNLSLEITNVKVAEMYPKELPDLFRGSQVVVIGTYTGDGAAAIRLKGQVGKKTEEFVYEATFPKKATDRSFIGSIYAHRKIGFLMDQIRLHGENKEIKDEVIRLSLAYGIETPYTSYLVLENEAQYKQYGITSTTVAKAGEARREALHDGSDRTRVLGVGGGGNEIGGMEGFGSSPVPPGAVPTAAAPTAPAASMEKKADAVTSYFYGSASGGGGAGGGGRGKAGSGFAEESQATADAPVRFSGGPAAVSPATPPASGDGHGQVVATAKPDFAPKDKEAPLLRLSAQSMAADSGKDAVDVATSIQKLRQSEGEKDLKGVQRIQQRAGRQFVNFRGVWVDERFLGTEKITKVKWGSEAFFRLLRDKPELKDVFSLGQRMIVATAKGQAVAVDVEEGVEKLTDAEAKALFTDVPEPKK